MGLLWVTCVDKGLPEHFRASRTFHLQMSVRNAGGVSSLAPNITQHALPCSVLGQPRLRSMRSAPCLRTEDMRSNGHSDSQ